MHKVIKRIAENCTQLTQPIRIEDPIDPAFLSECNTIIESPPPNTPKFSLASALGACILHSLDSATDEGLVELLKDYSILNSHYQFWESIRKRKYPHVVEERVWKIIEHTPDEQLSSKHFFFGLNYIDKSQHSLPDEKVRDFIHSWAIYIGRYKYCVEGLHPSYKHFYKEEPEKAFRDIKKLWSAVCLGEKEYQRTLDYLHARMLVGEIACEALYSEKKSLDKKWVDFILESPNFYRDNTIVKGITKYQLDYFVEKYGKDQLKNDIISGKMPMSILRGTTSVWSQQDWLDIFQQCKKAHLKSYAIQQIQLDKSNIHPVLNTIQDRLQSSKTKSVEKKELHKTLGKAREQLINQLVEESENTEEEFTPSL